MAPPHHHLLDTLNISLHHSLSSSIKQPKTYHPLTSQMLCFPPKQSNIMATSQLFPHTLLFLLLSTTLLHSYALAGGSIGINYGRIADDLPSAAKVVTLLKSQSLAKSKLYDSDPSVLKAFSSSNIKLTVALPNNLLAKVSQSSTFAESWVKENIATYYPDTQIEAIAVGNEVFVDPNNTTNYLVPAMKNVHAALRKLNIDTNIKVSSPVALSALQSSYPPSSGSFKPELLEPVIKPMLEFLHQTNSSLMVNAYPFFAYIGNADVISLDYALFKENSGNVDSGNGLKYFSLFDAQLDAVYAAMATAGYKDLKIVVSETGWPSKGDENEKGASEENAAAYNGNLVKRVLTGSGTPLRPDMDLEVYLFALFNENQKPGPTSERNYGLFYPDEKKVYTIPLTVEGLKGWNGGKSQTTPVNGSTGGGTEQAAPPTVSVGSGGVGTKGMTWCVANGKLNEEKLQKGLDYACGEGGADCRPIQIGATCYDPNTVEAHASYAFNSYYQKKSHAMGTCDFGGAAYIVTQPPQYGKCEFPTGY